SPSFLRHAGPHGAFGAWRVVATPKIGADYRRNKGLRKQRRARRDRIRCPRRSAGCRQGRARLICTLGSHFPLVFLFCSGIVTPRQLHTSQGEGVMKSVISMSAIAMALVGKSAVSVIGATILCMVIGIGAARAEEAAAPATAAAPVVAAAVPPAAAKAAKPQ